MRSDQNISDTIVPTRSFLKASTSIFFLFFVLFRVASRLSSFFAILRLCVRIRLDKISKQLYLAGEQTRCFKKPGFSER